jgi:hypothetical protein
VGAFEVADATPLDVIDREGADAARRLLPMEVLLPSLPAVRLTDTGEARARHGNLLALHHVTAWEEAPAPAAQNHAQPVRYRVLSAAGELMAIAEAGPHGLQPAIVLV